MKHISIVRSLTPRLNRSVDLYLQDIASYPLLTPEEEVELAQRIHQGDMPALEKMVLGNLRFVVTVAKQYMNLGLELSDLISAGNIGLIRAAERFDETRGFRFTSYAVWYINQAIHVELTDNARLVRIPSNKAGMLTRIAFATRELEQQLDRKPTLEELADKLEVTKSQLESVLQFENGVASLNNPLADSDGEQELIDVVEDKQTASPDDKLMRESLSKTINEALTIFDEKDRSIMKMWFNLDGDKEYSPGEVAEKMGLTLERCRQIVQKCLCRLKKSRYAVQLAAFL